MKIILLTCDLMKYIYIYNTGLFVVLMVERLISYLLYLISDFFYILYISYINLIYILYILYISYIYLICEGFICCFFGTLLWIRSVDFFTVSTLYQEHCILYTVYCTRIKFRCFEDVTLYFLWVELSILKGINY